jgi:hypothetical protein
LGWFIEVPSNEMVQVAQQFVCVLPFTVPWKHEPPEATPPALAGAPASASVPVVPVIWKYALPLGAFGGTCHTSSISEAETLVTVIVAADVVVPDSPFVDAFW